MLLFALSCFYHLIDIQMKLFKTEEHASVAISLGIMAMIYSDLGQLQKALEINQRAYSRKT